MIIPTLNEEAALPATLATLCSAAGDCEVIIADGGSTDRTVEIAHDAGARVLPCPSGRARQMNAGARAARGDLLLFLHADTRLPEGFDVQVRAALTEPRTALGAFRLAIDAPGRAFRLVERLVAWRCRWLRLPYGDQALFLRARVFAALSEFPEIPVLEDFVLVRRARRAGRIVTLAAAARTSARRWQAHGVVRTTLVNRATTLAYQLGVKPETIARWRQHRFGATKIDTSCTPASLPDRR